MPQFDIAHIKVQGQDVILVALDRQFGYQSDDEKQDALAEFEMRCASAGLRGGVAVVWDAGGGRMGFIGPPNWHGYLRSINLSYAIANRNRTLSW